jgi:hypothetical protein
MQPIKETDGTRTALKPAPPDTTEILGAPATLQALKLVFETLMAVARDTATPPPRTAVKGEYCPAPLAEQFQNVLDDNKTEALLLPLGISTDTPPPLLLEGRPTVPIATTTEQLLNDDDCSLTLANATLLAYTAPPPPLAAPGTTDVELVTAEHAVKLQLDTENVTLDPANFGACGGCSTPLRNTDTCGECSRDNAPPYTEAVPVAGPPVNETAAQSVNELPVTATRESCIEVVPNDVKSVR